VTRPPEAAPFDLRGKTVLVTGAARRIGRSIALRLAAEGARVAIHYSTSEEEARRTAAECGGAPVFRANLEHVAEIAEMFGRVASTLGRLDALVNNAARFTRRNVLEVSEADWDFIHSVNLKAYFFCAQQAARLMRAQGAPGRIVNISSLGGLQAWAEHVPYCASKAGVIHMTRALAKALAPDITVNSVAPGFIPFEARDYTQTSEGMIRDTPAGRAGHADEAADAVLFFLRAPGYITGQTIAVDGGLSLR
jgi:3-oxoacyl-[acyl-carrier protein] reductase/pteridine reductase